MHCVASRDRAIRGVAMTISLLLGTYTTHNHKYENDQHTKWISQWKNQVWEFDLWNQKHPTNKKEFVRNSCPLKVLSRSNKNKMSSENCTKTQWPKNDKRMYM